MVAAASEPSDSGSSELEMISIEDVFGDEASERFEVGVEENAHQVSSPTLVDATPVWISAMGMAVGNPRQISGETINSLPSIHFPNGRNENVGGAAARNSSGGGRTDSPPVAMYQPPADNEIQAWQIILACKARAQEAAKPMRATQIVKAWVQTAMTTMPRLSMVPGAASRDSTSAASRKSTRSCWTGEDDAEKCLESSGELALSCRSEWLAHVLRSNLASVREMSFPSSPLTSVNDSTPAAEILEVASKKSEARRSDSAESDRFFELSLDLRSRAVDKVRAVHKVRAVDGLRSKWSKLGTWGAVH